MNRKVLYEADFRQRFITFSGTVFPFFCHQVAGFLGPNDRLSGIWIFLALVIGH